MRPDFTARIECTRSNPQAGCLPFKPIDVRFTSPVPAGTRIRGRFKLAGWERLPNNGCQVTWAVTMEREGGDKPVCVAEAVSRHFY